MIEEIKKCARVLRDGGTILYPTDTIWGIGCDATNEAAVQKVFDIKNRPSSKSMIILVAEVHQISFYAEVPPVALDLAEFSETPLTIIYPRAKGIAKALVAEDGSIAIRVVKDEFCKMLIDTIRKPLVSTSANISGEPAPDIFDAIDEDIRSKVDYVVNLRQHETKKSAPSKIIKIEMDGTFQIIRK
ncbi:MAG TPA: L-threonylcarbamoyladenylate synthase [Bacteroidia bacterium]|jgi:L-threonylcarbamoyladenylate synthase|nr:L-threonylcarbamoyladenylate synthase [Bacteroidia bacterium]